jgi:hypothetical protein
MAKQPGSFRRIVSALLVVSGMALAGLAGAGLGGAAVYTVVRDRLSETAAAAPTPAAQVIVATQPPQPVGTINTSVNFDSAVTEAVGKVGPAVRLGLGCDHFA